MPYLKPAFVTHRAYSGDSQLSRYTDMTILGGVLYATTGYGGRVEAWSITGDTLSRFDTMNHARGGAAGVSAHLIGLTFGATEYLITGGGWTGALSRISLTRSGYLNTQATLGSYASWAGDMHGMASHTLNNGSTVVYGGLANGSGIGQLQFSSGGALQHAWTTSDSPESSAHGVTDMAAATIAGSRYVFSSGVQDLGLSSWEVQSDGGLTLVETLASDDGLWIAAPKQLEAVTVAGTTYLVLASSGSNSLTVAEVNLLGGMRVVDHVIDNLNSRFDNVQTIETIQYGAFRYVVAAGADGGLTVFMLLPDGRLLEQGTIADTNQMSLRNVSAIEAEVTANGFAIFVSSASGIGITRLQYEVGPEGSLYSADTAPQYLVGTSGADLMDGGDGDDTLQSGNGNDVLIDGAGNDALSGGSGADTFVFTPDGDYDRITDFDPLNDRIDLSQWVGLRGVSQLTITDHANGYRIVFGDETLDVRSSNWHGFSLKMLPETALIGLDRIPLELQPIPSNSTPEVNPEIQNGTEFDDRIVASNRNTILNGQLGDDTLIGGNGVDKLYGGDGDDLLISGGGTGDMLYGGDGDDVIYIGTVWDIELG